MKKFTLLIVFFVCAIGFSQISINPEVVMAQSAVPINYDIQQELLVHSNLNKSQEGSSSIEGSSLLNRRATCNEENPSNAFENAYDSGGSDATSQLMASDMTIPADTDFSLTSVNVNLWILGLGDTIASAEVVIYGDIGGLPDSANIIASFPKLVPTLQTVLGTALTENEVFNVTFDIPATMLAGQAGATTTYWISIYAIASNNINVYWEANNESVIGNQAAFGDRNSGIWFGYAPSDMVYNFSGDCTTTLGINDNTIEGFSYYPNPAESTINLSSQGTIESVVLYNMLGQQIFDQNINATTSELNVSDLATGNYFMKVSVNGQIGTFKILKK